MAEAQKIKALALTTVEVDRVRLDLTLEEAQFLDFVMDRIGGDPVKSRRRYANNISGALRGIVPILPWSDKTDVEYEGYGPGSIYFKDELNG